jgi:hypothetical protein
MSDEADLFRKRLDYIEQSLAVLHDEVDKNHTIASEKIGAIQNAVKELQLMVYGESRYGLAGLASQIKTMTDRLETMQDEREALRNQIKGMSLVVKLVGLTGAGTLISVIAQLLG